MMDKHEWGALERCARSLFPAEVAVVLRDTQGDPGMLSPQEAEYITRAVPKRRAEFAAGRDALKTAMTRLTMTPGPILRGEDRAPVWPQGLTGALSHSTRGNGNGVCFAAMAKSQDIKALGNDIEEALPLEEDLIPRICTPDEIARLPALGDDSRGLMAKRIFSVKESAYKAQYAQSRRVFGFQTFDVRFDGDRFQAVFTCDIPPFRRGDSLTGLSKIATGWILSGMTLRA